MINHPLQNRLYLFYDKLSTVFCKNIVTVKKFERNKLHNKLDKWKNIFGEFTKNYEKDLLNLFVTYELRKQRFFRKVSVFHKLERKER